MNQAPIEIIKQSLSKIVEPGQFKVTIDPEHRAEFLVFLQISIGEKGAQNPTKKAISDITDQLRAQSILVQFILQELSQTRILETVKTALENKFTGKINNAFLNNAEKLIWIEPRRTLDQPSRLEVQSTVESLLGLLNAQHIKINFTNTANLPTPTVIASTIRKHAPISVELLSSKLKSQNFEIPDQALIDRALDKLRKSGRIVRLKKSGKYALTLKGLRSLGSRKDRHSPDVKRALAINASER